MEISAFDGASKKLHKKTAAPLKRGAAKGWIYVVERFIQIKNDGNATNNSQDIWSVEIVKNVYYISYRGQQICYGAVEAGMSCAEILRMCSGKEYLRVS